MLLAFPVLDLEDTFVVEHEAYGAAGPQRTAALGEVASEICHGPGVVVGGRLDKESDAVRSVTLEHNLLEVTLVLLQSLLDCPLDILLRHILTSCLCHEGPETGVSGHIGTALLDGDGDFLADLGECLGHVAPSLEFSFLAEFKCSSHDYFWLSILVMYLSMS